METDKSTLIKDTKQTTLHLRKNTLFSGK